MTISTLKGLGDMVKLIGTFGASSLLAPAKGVAAKMAKKAAMNAMSKDFLKAQ